MPRSLHLLLIALAVSLQACSIGSRPAPDPVAFQYYSGNESLPPEFQRITIIRGTINRTTIDIVYRFRDANGTIERPLTVEGDRYQAYLELLRNTRIKAVPPAERPAGGGSVDVTVTGTDGQSTTGQPANVRDWQHFADEIAKSVGATPEAD